MDSETAKTIGILLLFFVFLPACLIQVVCALGNMRKVFKGSFVKSLILVLIVFPLIFIFAPVIVLGLLIKEVYDWFIRKEEK